MNNFRKLNLSRSAAQNQKTFGDKKEILSEERVRINSIITKCAPLDTRLEHDLIFTWLTSAVIRQRCRFVARHSIKAAVIPAPTGS